MASRSTQSSSRLESYSDAILSIVATVMILPIAHTEIPEDMILPRALADLLLGKIVVYIFAFLLVCDTWGRHVWLFDCIEKVDDILVMLNLALMMVTTFLPFTFTLLSTYYQFEAAIILFTSVLILVGGIQFLCIIHVFRTNDMLTEEVKNSEDKTGIRNQMIATVLTPVAITCLGLAVCSFSTFTARVVLLLLIFGNFLRRFMVRMWCFISDRFFGRNIIEIEVPGNFQERLLKESFSKERTECFNDGVFAIVATLIILDICERDIPTEAQVKAHGGRLMDTMDPKNFLSYAGTFSTVGLLWHVNHSLFDHLKRINRLLLIFNHTSLLCVGLMPLTFQLINNFKDSTDLQSESLSVQLTCVAVFCASLSQALMFITGLLSGDRLLEESAHYGGDEHFQIAAKLAVFPIFSLLVYGVCFSQRFMSDALHAMEVGVIAVFVALHLLDVLLHKRRARSNQTEEAGENRHLAPSSVNESYGCVE